MQKTWVSIHALTDSSPADRRELSFETESDPRRSNVRANLEIARMRGRMGYPPEARYRPRRRGGLLCRSRGHNCGHTRLGLPGDRGQLRRAAGAGDCGCGFETATECDRLAKAGYELGRDRISTGDGTWLHSLPKTLRFTLGGLKYRVVHGRIDLIDRFVLHSDREVIADELERGMPKLSSPTVGCGSIPELSVCPRTMAPPYLVWASRAQG